jgi:hypothetical protein
VRQGDPGRRGRTEAWCEFPSPASPAVTLKDLNADGVPVRLLPGPSCLRQWTMEVLLAVETNAC